MASRYGRPRQWFAFAVIVRETPGTEAPIAKSPLAFAGPVGPVYAMGRVTHSPRKSPPPWVNVKTAVAAFGARSEERRVGKECRSRWSPCNEKKERYAND